MHSASHHATSAETSNKTTSADAYKLLVAQRKLRPIAPHLTIYQPQLTMVMSGFTRLTGVALAGTVYIFGILYAAAPLTGMHLEAATLAAGFAAWPLAAQLSLKGALTLPFAYHFFNGLRHMNWDMARSLSIPGVYRTGYAVLAATAVSATYFTFLA